MKHGISLRHNAELKNHGTAAMGEILGTTMFLFIVRLPQLSTTLSSPSNMLISNEQAEGAAKTANLARTAVQTQTNAPLDVATIQMIATAFGLSLLVCAWTFYRVTGGLFK